MMLANFIFTSILTIKIQKIHFIDNYKGTLALQISRETVPDLETAKINFFSICFFIFSSEITSTYADLHY